MPSRSMERLRGQDISDNNQQKEECGSRREGQVRATENNPS